MSLTEDQLVSQIRRTNPAGYENWSDEQILSVILRDDPSLARHVITKSPGEYGYEEYGAAASAGFGKRFGFQFGTQWEEMKAGAMGMMPWVETEAAESARRFSICGWTFKSKRQ